MMSAMDITGGCWCGGTYEAGRVEVRVPRADGPHLVLEHVPQGRCDRCERAVYSSADFERLESALRDEPVVVRG